MGLAEENVLDVGWLVFFLKVELVVLATGNAIIWIDKMKINTDKITRIIEEKLYSNISFAYSSTSTLSDPTPVLTIDKINELIKEIAKDPIADFMKEKGFDPKDGCLLMCPECYREVLGENIPGYIKFSLLISEPVLVNPNFELIRVFSAIV